MGKYVDNSDIVTEIMNIIEERLDVEYSEDYYNKYKQKIYLLVEEMENNINAKI